MGQTCHLKTTGSPSRGQWRGWVSLQWCCLLWMRQSQAMEEASPRGSKELGTGLQQANPSGISGSKAFPERQRKTFNHLVSRQLPARQGWHRHAGGPGATSLEKGHPGHTGHSGLPVSVQMTVGIYTSFRAGWGSRSTRAGVAQHSWSCHLSWLDLAQVPEHSAPGGAPLQYPDLSITPTLWCPSIT